MRKFISSNIDRNFYKLDVVEERKLLMNRREWALDRLRVAVVEVVDEELLVNRLLLQLGPAHGVLMFAKTLSSKRLLKK